MIQPGGKILSFLLLLPILTILAHNSIPHHHHTETDEVCLANLPGHCGENHQLSHTAHGSAGPHNACCFNPEFTVDITKVLVAVIVTDHEQLVCLPDLSENDYTDPVNILLPGTYESAPLLLRGPPVP